MSVYSNVKSTPIETFTKRWVAFSIDITTVFTIFFFIKLNFQITRNWFLFLSITFLINILAPAFFSKGITIGKKLMRIQLDFPSNYSKMKCATAYIIRESIKILSILLTAGISLIITGIWIAESGKPSIHEKITKIYSVSYLKTKEVPFKDQFDGHFKL